MIIKTTQKPYYKKYFKKITIVLRKYISMKKYNVYSDYGNINYSIVYKECKEYVNKLLENNNIDVKTYIPKYTGNITFFYNDDILEELIDHKKFKILEKYIPISDKQITLQKNEMNIICRKNYFFEKYKYKLEMKLSEKKPYQDDFKIDLQKNIKNIKNILYDAYIRNTDKMFYINETRIGINLYLNEEEMAFYIKLLYDKSIKKFTYIVLEKDI